MTEQSRLRRLLGNDLRIGLGGEGILRTEGKVPGALAMLQAAYDGGIRYFDSAPAYAGSETYYGRFWAGHPERMDETFQASKSAERGEAGARDELRRTLTRTGRDRLGLWQMHDLRTREDLRAIEGPGGALQAFYHARQTGLAKGIGVTGHHDPDILLHAVSEWDVDSVLLPVNPVEAVIGGFADRVIPAARERGIGVIGMKVLGAGNFIFPDAGLTPETLIRFALAQDVDLIIVGCSTPHECGILSGIMKERSVMSGEEQERIKDTIRPYAERLAFYRGTL